MSFSKKQEGQPANCFFEAAGSGNLASQQFHLPAADQPCDFCVPVLDRIGRSLEIVPAIIAHASHSRQHCPHSGTSAGAGYISA
jgi:hypothetical protein